MRLRALIGAALVAATLATAALSASTATPALAANVGYGQIVSQFICVSCHEPLELVSSPQALSEKAYLASLVNRHMTVAQIKRAMVAQYGIGVLARPPARGLDLTVYILPPALLAAGLLVLALTLPRWRRRARQAAAASPDGAQPLGADDAERLDDELARFI